MWDGVERWRTVGDGGERCGTMESAEERHDEERWETVGDGEEG